MFAFPLINLIQRTLLRIRYQGMEEAIGVVTIWPARMWYLRIRYQGMEEAIVVVPRVVPIWPARMWYHLLVKMATDTPVLFKIEIERQAWHKAGHSKSQRL